MKHWIKFLPDSGGLDPYYISLQNCQDRVREAQRRLDIANKELSEMEEELVAQVQKEWSKEEIIKAKADFKASK